MKFPDDFVVEKEQLTLNDINFFRIIHKQDIASDFSHYNRQFNSISGKSAFKITVKKESLIQYFNDSGFPYTDHATNSDNSLIEHYAPTAKHNIDIFVDEMRKNFQRIIKLRYPHTSGDLVLFDETVPTCHLFIKKHNEHVPEFDYVPDNSSPESEKSKDEQPSPLDHHNHSKPERMLQVRLQEKADNNHTGNDDKQQPTKPTPPTPDNNDSSLRYSIRQQQQAIDDDDENDNKKKRDRRLQRQRNRQRQSQQQSQADKQAEEARIIRERCLADEAKRDAELKHPSTRKHGSRPSVNNHAHNHKTEGPEPF